MRIAGMASAGGTNLRYMNDARPGELVVIISNNSDAEILGYAENRAIPHYHLSSKTHPSSQELDGAIRDTLKEYDVDVVFLSGYMKKLGPLTIEGFTNRVLNIHPSLLPDYGGQGMYGDFVYQAVLAAGEVETGASLHIVDGEYDRGPIVMQESVPIYLDDTIDELRARVRECEKHITIEAFNGIADGSLDLDLVMALL